MVTTNLCYARDYPSDIDLKTAYCIGFKKDALEDLKLLANSYDELKGPYQEEIEKLTRMRAYLVPKIQYLKTQPLNVAMQMAKKDLAANGKSTRFCSKKYPNPATPTEEHSILFFNCVKEQDKLDFGYEARAARIQSCDELTWLPY